MTKPFFFHFSPIERVSCKRFSFPKEAAMETMQDKVERQTHCALNTEAIPTRLPVVPGANIVVTGNYTTQSN